jgi:hypothetical protein
MSEQGLLDILSGMDANPALGVGKPSMPSPAGAFSLTDTVEKEYAACRANGIAIKCWISPREISA